MSNSEHPTLLRARDIKTSEEHYSHPWNQHSEIYGHPLSRRVGLQRTAISKIRIPPGKESFVYHAHHCEEEWIFILSGRGIADIDDREYQIGPGDFLGFPTPSVAHHLRNPFDEDLVYLMGGESRQVEIADYPRHNRRMVRHGDSIEIYRLDSAMSFEDPIEPPPDHADRRDG